jgi:hypothetical protein
VNYGHLADALEFYHGRGYSYVEDAPWAVGKAAYYATKPPGAAPDVHIFCGPPGVLSFPADNFDNQYLVASGEQSFIQMMMDGQPLKRAMCVTPCFRIEKHDALRRPYFQKVELINADDPTVENLIMMVHDALSFFSNYVDVKVIQTYADETKPSYDIVEKYTRIELGSYGIREIKHGNRFIEWIYGTGCAEPRLTTAIDRSFKERH